MNMVRPVNEEFMYCDPERIHDNDNPNEQEHACQVCWLGEKLAASDEEIRRLRHDCK